LLAGLALKTLYTIAGRQILIDAQDEWAARAVSNLFSGWFLKPLAANGNVFPHATLRVRLGDTPPRIPNGLCTFQIAEGGTCHTDGQTFYLDFNGSVVSIGPGMDPGVDIWLTQRYDFGSRVLAQIISQGLSAAWRRFELYELHSAAVIPPGQEKAALIAGGSGSGKTTLTLQLASSGWNYLSDDVVLLSNDHDDLEIYALRKFFALRPHTIAALELSQVLPYVVTLAAKERVRPQSLFSGRQVEQARPHATLFPSITQRATSEMRPLTAGEAMTRLLRLCPWASYDKPTAAKHLALLARLSKECVAFELLAGTELLENQGLAAELCMKMY